MFGLTAQKEMPPQAPTRVVRRKPEPKMLEHGVVDLGTYEVLAKELDYCPAQLLEEYLLRFLAEEKIPIYDYDEIMKYLITIAEAKNKTIMWRPLREKDRPTFNLRATHIHDAGSRYYHHGEYLLDWNFSSYPYAVPIHILRNVKKIQDRFGGDVQFFVSDYSVAIPDPFIMVTARDIKRTVFGAWDEPGFFAKEE